MQGIHGGDIYRNKVEMDFSVNINPLGMPERVKEALHQAVNRCQEYPDISALKLKKAVSQTLHVKEEYLVFGNGASELFMGIIHGLKPKKVFIPVPSFFGYEHAANAGACEMISFFLEEEKEFLPDEGLIDAIEDDIDLLFLANPNNPTGKKLSRAYLENLLRVCEKKQVYVVLDECFIEFCDGETSMLPLIEKYPNLVLVRAFTKSYAIPGVRLGYLICSNEEILEKIKQHLPEWNLSVFAEEAGTACMKEQAFLDETVKYVEKERIFLTEELRKLEFRVFSSEANFILIYSEKPLYEKLLKRGILIRDCANYRGLSKGYYRIAVKTRMENEKLLKVMGERIG